MREVSPLAGLLHAAAAKRTEEWCGVQLVALHSIAVSITRLPLQRALAKNATQSNAFKRVCLNQVLRELIKPHRC